MRLLILFLLLLLLAGCMANRQTVAEKPLASLTSVSPSATLTIVLQDSLPAHTAPETTVLSKLLSAGKIKNKGTIIIQSGAGSVASPVTKSKAPITLATGQATATTMEKTKAPGVVTSGDNSPATVAETKRDYSCLWYLLLAVGIGFLYYKYKTR